MGKRCIGGRHEHGDDACGKAGGSDRMVYSQRTMETPLFVLWLFPFYVDRLEVLPMAKGLIGADFFSV